MQEDQQLAIPDSSVRLGAVRAESPADIVDVAAKVANKLADVIESTKLYVKIGNNKFPRCEAWTTCAAMLGVSPKEESAIENENGEFEATVSLIDGEGKIVGRASAICGGPDEPVWAKRSRNARRSMSITRATSKACRLKFSWILVLAGYQPTPAEEMEDEKDVGTTPFHQAKKEMSRQERHEAEFNRQMEEEKAINHPQKKPKKWQDVVCQTGREGGDVRGKTLGEIAATTPHRMQDLYNSFVDKRHPEYMKTIHPKNNELIAALMEWGSEQEHDDKIPLGPSESNEPY